MGSRDGRIGDRLLSRNGGGRKELVVPLYATVVVVVVVVVVAVVMVKISEEAETAGVGGEPGIYHPCSRDRLDKKRLLSRDSQLLQLQLSTLRSCIFSFLPRGPNWRAVYTTPS